MEELRTEQNNEPRDVSAETWSRSRETIANRAWTSLQEIVATLDEGNKNSRNVLEKAGFSYGGRIRSYGKDGPVYRISKEKWTELNQD